MSEKRACIFKDQTQCLLVLFEELTIVSCMKMKEVSACEGATDREEEGRERERVGGESIIDIQKKLKKKLRS